MAKNVNIKINADTQNAKKGIDNLTQTANELQKQISKQTAPFTKFAKAVTGVTFPFNQFVKAAGSAVVGLKKMGETIKETTELYKTQAKAEILLETAAKNNPYLDGTSVRELKNYASQLQSISTIGDEQLLPMMAQLASSGRTQSEIQSIMSAALDVSASGAMSLESAVRNLNKTYGGLSGELGETVPQIKALTTEELKAGKAVEVIANQYKGMAKATSSTVGTTEQLKNAWGDLKETFGQPFERAMSPMRSFFTELVSGWATARKAKQDYNDAKKADVEGTATLEQLQVLLENSRKELEDAQAKAAKKGYGSLDGYSLGGALGATVMKNGVEQSGTAAKLIGPWLHAKEAVESYEQQIKDAQKAAQDERTQAQLESELAIIKNSVSASKTHVDALYEKAAIEKTSTDTVEFQSSVLEKMQEDYLALAHETATYSGLAKATAQTELSAMEAKIAKQAEVVEGLKAEKTATEESKKAREDAYKAAQKEADEVLKSVEKLLGTEATEGSLVEQLKETIKDLKELRSLFADGSEEANNLTAQINLLENALKDAKEIKFAEGLEESIEVMEKFSDVIGQVFGALDETLATLADNIESSSEAQLEHIEDLYEAGIISSEEYASRKEKIEQDTAKKQYQIELWQWRSSLIQAAIDTASSVLKNLAAYPQPLGGIMAGISAAAGAIQVAAITANRPTAPHFASGGIVSGTNKSNDNVSTLLTAGEMVLNDAQQKHLWNLVSGATTMGTSVKIVNNASNVVKATPEINENAINLYIDARVTDSIRKGRYDTSLLQYETNRNGIEYGV